MSDRYVDGGYLERNPDWHTGDSEWKAARIVETLRRAGLRPGSVCEIGCGAGAVLATLGAAMPEIRQLDGFDVSPQALQLAAVRATDRIRFHEGQPEGGAHYDLLMAVDVMEHVEDYIGFLRSLRPLASHQLFHIPLDLSVQTLLRARPLAEVRRLVGHLHYFTRETALATLVHCGYEIVDEHYTAGALDLPSRHRAAALLRVPRRALRAINPHLAARILGGFSLMVLARPGAGER